MGTLDKRYTSSSIAKMILSRLAFSAAVVAGQYADYYNNYSDLDIDSIDKGFVYSGTDDLGNKKNKNKNQQDFFGQAAKQQLDAGLAGTHHVNGHTCWTCHGKSYAECNTSGATAYCEGEQFHSVSSSQYGQLCLRNTLTCVYPSGTCLLAANGYHRCYLHSCQFSVFG